MSAEGPPAFCPHCGAEVPDHAKACPECGACEETGWSESAHSDRLGLPDEDFSYDAFMDREFGGEDRRLAKAATRKRLILGIGAVVLIVVLLAWG